MQHFLLSAKGRNLSLKKIYKMGEAKASYEGHYLSILAYR